MKFTKHNLKKVEHLLEELGYSVRYEKGNFQSGSINVLKDKTGKINSISIDSLGGKFTIPIVSKNGMMTIDSNRYFSRPQFNADGLKASKPYGLDVAMVRFINENYE